MMYNMYKRSAKNALKERVGEAKGGQIMPGDYVKNQHGNIYQRVDGKVGKHDAYVRVTNGKAGKKKTGLHDSFKLTLINKDELKENVDKVVGGIPYRRHGNKVIISEPLDDATKERLIGRAKKHGYFAQPNQAGGITITLKKGMYEELKESTINEVKEMTFGAYLDDLDNRFVDLMKAAKGLNAEGSQEIDMRATINQNFTLFRNYISALKKEYSNELNKELTFSINETKEVKEDIDKVAGGFKKGDKVTYLGHPAIVTATKEYNGRSFVSVSYDKGTGKTKVSNVLVTSGDVKAVNEIDINDPVMMRMRAAKDKKPDFGKEYGDAVKVAYGNDKNAKKLAFLKKERAQLMRDMEQEAEPEGGPIADEYGSKLNRIDAAIAKLSGRKEMTYDQAIAENKILKQAKLSSAEYQKAKKLKGVNKDDYKWNPSESLYIKAVGRVNEQMDIYDDIANEEFGMDYDQLGSNEQQWVHDEIDSMPKLNEDVSKHTVKHSKSNNTYQVWLGDEIVTDFATKERADAEAKRLNALQNVNEAKKDIYDRFLENPTSPKGRAKAIISKFKKKYGEDATEMAVDRFSKQNNLKPKEKYILKYITKNDIKITSQPGGPNLSVVNEAKATCCHRCGRVHVKGSGCKKPYLKGKDSCAINEIETLKEFFNK